MTLLVLAAAVALVVCFVGYVIRQRRIEQAALRDFYERQRGNG